MQGMSTRRSVNYLLFNITPIYIVFGLINASKCLIEATSMPATMPHFVPCSTISAISPLFPHPLFLFLMVQIGQIENEEGRFFIEITDTLWD